MMRELILSIVKAHQGLKGTELVLILMGDYGPVTFPEKEYITELNKLIRDKDIVEWSYLTPGISGERSMYFPKGTKLIRMNMVR